MPNRRRSWSRASVERAMVHHLGPARTDVDMVAEWGSFTPPRGGTRYWVNCVGIGTQEFTLQELHAFVVGLADMKRRVEAVATRGENHR